MGRARNTAIRKERGWTVQHERGAKETAQWRTYLSEHGISRSRSRSDPIHSAGIVNCAGFGLVVSSYRVVEGLVSGYIYLMGKGRSSAKPRENMLVSSINLGITNIVTSNNLHRCLQVSLINEANQLRVPFCVWWHPSSVTSGTLVAASLLSSTNTYLPL